MVADKINYLNTFIRNEENIFLLLFKEDQNKLFKFLPSLITCRFIAQCDLLSTSYTIVSLLNTHLYEKAKAKKEDNNIYLM